MKEREEGWMQKGEDAASRRCIGTEVLEPFNRSLQREPCEAVQCATVPRPPVQLRPESRSS